MIKISKRMQTNIETTNKWSINSKYDTIILGDPNCGKSKYLKLLAENEKKSNLPILISDEENEFEFWIETRSKKAIFNVKDTADQERYRSLTQNYYRKAQSVLLIFDIYNQESFYNLNKWHSDILNYCKIQDNLFSIVLIGINSKPYKKESVKIDLKLIEKFQQEKSFIVGFCEINLYNLDQVNLKEPFEILLEHFTDSRFISNNLNFNNNNNNFESNETINLLTISKTQTKRSCLNFCLLN